MFSGYKTYIVAVGMLCYAWGGVIAVIHDLDTAVKMTMEALALMGLRAGVSKAIK